MDFAAAAREVGIPIGILSAAMIAGVCIGYAGEYLEKWYKAKYSKPERKPFEGIRTYTLGDFLPKS